MARAIFGFCASDFARMTGGIAITLDTYSHVLPTMQESAIRALEDALK